MEVFVIFVEVSSDRVGVVLISCLSKMVRAFLGGVCRGEGDFWVQCVRVRALEPVSLHHLSRHDPLSKIA